MATVFEGRDLKLERPVAIKLLRPHLAGDASFANRFNQEARAVAELSHPNIAGVYDTGVDNGQHYIIMELLPGPTLSELLAGVPNGRLPAEQVMRIGGEVARALGAAHSRGVVHRDVKPANIIFAANGAAKVTDLGIARALAQAETTDTGAILGSPHYLSPEQVKGETAGPRSDIYSLGVVLYQMLTGHTPYRGDTPLAIAVQHVQGTPPSLSAEVPDLPAGLAAVVAKAMARDPEDRFGSAAEVVDALAAVRSGLPLPFTPLPTGPVLPGHGVPMAGDPAQLERTTVMSVPAATATASAVGRPRYEDDEERTRQRGPVWPIAVALLVILGVAVGIGYALLYPEQPPTPAPPPLPTTPAQPKQITVPDLTGKHVPTERDRLNRYYQGQETRPPQIWEMGNEDSGLPAGQVVRQQPEAGTTMEEGGTIRVWLSTGIERIAVPRLVGQAESVARTTLIAGRLQVGRIAQDYSDDFGAGMVMAQSIRGGERVTVNTPVDLTISLGPREPEPPPLPEPPPALPPMPDVAHTPLEEVGGGWRQTTVTVHLSAELPPETPPANVELRWLSGGEGSPGGGRVSPGADFSAVVQGPADAQLEVLVNGESVRVITF